MNGKLGNQEWVTIQDIPLSIMAIVAIKDASPDACMTCRELHYPTLKGSTKVLAVDGAESGILLSIDTMNTLTHGRAKELGSIEVEAIEVPMMNCGISDQIWAEIRGDDAI
ncbi:Epl1 protein [Fusarium sp. MPI-SDFR-AT-0072]|nr:Epl1 protein [Fusarium sp. MPI-SDFR-AT-0072]